MPLNQSQLRSILKSLALKSSALLLLSLCLSAIAAPECVQAGPLIIEPGTQGTLATYARGQYRVRKLDNSVLVQTCGETGWIPTPGSFLSGGNGVFAAWNPSTGIWNVCSGTTIAARQWGLPGDIPVPADFNADGLTDFVVYRPQTGQWFQQLNTGGVPNGPQSVFQFGLPGDFPVPADYDNDGIADRAVFRADSTSGATVWYLSLSSGGAVVQPYGLVGDLPVPADFEGSGQANIAVWRPTNGTWYIRLDGGSSVEFQFGLPGDIPAPADLDNDGVSELVIYRPSESRFYYRKTAPASPTQTFQLGTVGSVIANDSRSAVVDRSALGDFNGDRITDLAIVRASGGSLELLLNTGTVFPHPTPRTQLGSVGDVLAPADYDGDGITDQAVVERSAPFLAWRILRSSVQSGTRNEIRVLYGLVGDRVVPADYDGDRKADIAVVRTLPSRQLLWIPAASSGALLGPIPWGLEQDRTFAADFDGDGRADYVVVRAAGNQLYWYVLTQSGFALPPKVFGLASDQPFVCDCLGDGKARVAVVRESGNFRYVYIDGAVPFIWGIAGDISLFGDYSGTTARTAAVWRLAGGQGYFFLRQAVSGVAVKPFGVRGDLPLSLAAAAPSG